MTPKQFYKGASKDEVTRVAKEAGTSYGNFQQIALFNGAVGKALAERLAAASEGRMSELEILYPERYEDDHAA